MEDKIIALLRDLASQLGTTVDNIMAILTKQAIISTYSYFIGYFTIIFAFCLWLWATHKAKAIAKPLNGWKDSWGNTHRVSMWDIMFDNDDNEHVGVAITWVVSLVWWGIGMCVFLGTVGDIITRLANPRFWALNHIFNAIGGK